VFVCYEQVCQNCEVLAQFVVSANVQPSKIDAQCLQGIPKDLINDVINLKFGSGLDGLSDLIAIAPRKEAARELQPSSTAIMNDPSMGDPVDSMCFFKTIMGPGETEESCEIADIAGDVAKAQGNDDRNTITSEDKQIEDDRSLEQIMGFATDMNVQTGDIGQNVEEILQVILGSRYLRGSSTSHVSVKQVKYPLVQITTPRLFLYFH
jgi:KAT8 regulatory NSL complex subunit 1